MAAERLFRKPGVSFPSKYRGVCWSCGERWEVGTLVCYVGRGVLVHADHCAAVALALYHRASDPRCDPILGADDSVPQQGDWTA